MQEMENAKPTLSVGDIVTGRVIKVKPFGAVVELPDRKHGLVHISHISQKYVQDVNDYLAAGDIITVKILSIDQQSGKVALSMKEVPGNEQALADALAAIEEEEQAEEGDSYGFVYMPSEEHGRSFEEKFKDWQKSANERQARINKRNKRR